MPFAVVTPARCNRCAFASAHAGCRWPIRAAPTSLLISVARSPGLAMLCLMSATSIVLKPFLQRGSRVILGWAVLTNWEDVWPRGCTADGHEKIALVTGDRILPACSSSSFRKVREGLGLS